MIDLTIFSVATERYLPFWVNLVKSAQKHISGDISVQWVLFTDLEEIATSLSKELGINLYVSNYEGGEWPMPTLLRYELMSNVKVNIKGRIVMHLDADMLFVNQVTKLDLDEAISKNEIALIGHPGFFRPNGVDRFKFYFSHYSYLIRDIKSFLLIGGIGSWETNRNSRAFIPRKKRKIYVCGGTWFGNRNSILELCSMLSSRINEDLENGVIAKFHDESHLNWFAANFNYTINSPEYCYEESYPQLQNLKPKIIAIDKNANSTWIR